MNLETDTNQGNNHVSDQSSNHDDDTSGLAENVSQNGSNDDFNTETHRVHLQPHPQNQPQPLQQRGTIPTDPDFIKRVLKPVPDYPIGDEIHYVWEIADWSTLRRSHKVQSPIFMCGGCLWRISLFPRSNTEAISVYLEPVPPTLGKTGNNQINEGEENLTENIKLKGDDQSLNDSNLISIDEANADPKNANESSTNSTEKDWHVCAQFALDLWNPLNPAAHVPSATSHRFTTREQDWGFSALISPRELVARGILEKNILNISACLRIIDDSSTGMLWHDFFGYDLKKSTGYVGLTNQGATCYLNLLLQLYFVTGAFRALVYEIPTENTGDSVKNSGISVTKIQGSGSTSSNTLVNPEIIPQIVKLNLIDGEPVIDVVSKLSNKPDTDDNLQDLNLGKTPPKRARAVALAMQRVFAEMQLALTPVSTLELTRSFGWDSSDAFTQHDVQELNRILMDTLESAMSGSAVEKRLNSLFVGAMKLYVKCINVRYELSRIEPFWDIQLNVQGMRNLQESFLDYILSELLTGPNQYDAGSEYGYQDAKKGVFFQWFPPVLHLQLKRFEYDFEADDLVKIDDLYEFPDSVDLSPYLGDVPDSVRQQNWTYRLHGVLVHQGSVSNGHYYAMLKPLAALGSLSLWCRFDDDKVWKVTANQVFHENFGALSLPVHTLRSLLRAEQNEYVLRRATSAYMLVYYREEALRTILPGTGISVPDHVQEQIDAEKAAVTARNQQRLEALHYLNASLITVFEFEHYTGVDIYPDPTGLKLLGRHDFDTHSYPSQIKVRKDAKVRDLVKAAGTQLGYKPSELGTNPSEFPFSLFAVKPRTNKTVRPEFLITAEMMNESISQFYMRHFKRRGEEMVFFAYEPKQDLFIETRLRSFPADNALLLIKYYDPATNEARGIGYVAVTRNIELSKLVAPINAKLGLKSDAGLELLEELSCTRIEGLDAELTLEKNELGTGDVIIAAPLGRSDQVSEYYKFLYSRVHIRLSLCKNPAHTQFTVRDSQSGADGQDSQPIEMWISSACKYSEFSAAVAAKVPGKVHPGNLRLYIVESSGMDGGDGEEDDGQGHKRYPIPSTVKLHQFLLRNSTAATVQLEYEVLTISLAEYEAMRCITIHWLRNVVDAALYDIFLPKSSRTADVVDTVLAKAQVPESMYSGILAWCSVNFKYTDLVKFDLCLDEIPVDAELCVGYFPAEVRILAEHGIYERYVASSAEADTAAGQNNEVLQIAAPEERMDDAEVAAVHEYEEAQVTQHSKQLNLVPVFHFYKLTNYTHSWPFLFAVFPDEKWRDTARRLNSKLGFETGEKMRVALADDNYKGRYLDLDEEMILFEEVGRHESISLALDHRDRNPRRYTQEKGISIG